MFEITRIGHVIKVNISYHVRHGIEWTSIFENDYTSEHYAQVTYATLREAMENEFQKVRREAYEQGWKDKSGKKRKRDWFSCRV